MLLRRRKSAAKGALAGVAGGLVAAFVMNQFQALVAKARKKEEQANRPPGEGHAAREQKSWSSGEEPATVKAAVAISEPIVHRELSPEEKKTGANVVHYAVGAAAGGLYGALAEKSSLVRAGFGTAFGAALWFVADEVAVPAFRLSKGPLEYPASTHFSALASHIVYGAATDLVRRGLRSL